MAGFDVVLAVAGPVLDRAVARLAGAVLRSAPAPLPIVVPNMSDTALEISGMSVSVGGDVGHPQLRCAIDLVVRGKVLLRSVPARANLPLGAVAQDVPVEFGGASQPRRPQLQITAPLTARLGGPGHRSLRFSLREATPEWTAPLDVAVMRSVVEAAVASRPSQVSGAIHPDAIGELLPRLHADLHAAVAQRLSALFSGLIMETDDILGPVADALPCDLSFQAHGGRAVVDVQPTAAGPVAVLRVGLAMRPETRLDATPPGNSFDPSGGLDAAIYVDNRFMLALLCCLIERLPNVGVGPRSWLPRNRRAVPPIGDLTVEGCEWTEVVVTAGPFTLRGVLRLLLEERHDGKRVLVQAAFHSALPDSPLPLLHLDAAIAAELRFGLDSAARLAAVGLAGPPRVEVDLRQGFALQGLAWALKHTVGILPTGRVAAEIIPLLVALLKEQLQSWLRTLLGPLQGLSSAPALPPALLEAFGRFVPATLRIDDLVVQGTFAGPLSPAGPAMRQAAVHRPFDIDRPALPRP